MAPHLLNEALIRQQIKNKQPITIEIFPQISSTIDHLKNQSEALDYPHICLAEVQTHGRGQLNRPWHGPFATNVHLSCSWLFQKAIPQLEGLSLAVGICVIRALIAYGLTQQISVKWPNDIYWQDKKLAGILIDTESRGIGSTLAIVSVGINVNMEIVPEGQITQSWTSLSKILGATQDRNKMTGLLIDQLLTDLAIFDAQGFAPFLVDWADYDYLRDKPVALKNVQGICSGIATGIDARGHLQICTAQGDIVTHASGELLKYNP